MFFDGLLGVLPLTYFYVSKSARLYLFPQSVKFITFAAAPLVLTQLVRNQTGQRLRQAAGARGRARDAAVPRQGSGRLLSATSSFFGDGRGYSTGAAPARRRSTGPLLLLL